MEEWLNERFELRQLGTDVWTEVRAGTTMFLTVAYILLVNPHIMGEPYTGLTGTDVVVGTAAAGAFGSIFVGWFANLPFGMAPGLGLSAYLSYGLVLGGGLPWEGAMTCAFVSGAILLVLGLTDLADACMRFIPKTIKIATVIGMGLLITFIALQSIGLVVASGDESMVKLGSLDNQNVWVSLFGLALLATLAHHRVTGGVAIGIFIVTVMIWAANNSWPQQVVQLPVESGPLYKAATKFELLAENPSGYLSGVCAFLMVGIFDVSGVMFGLAVLAGLEQEDKFGHIIVPGSRWVFISAGLSTMLAACLGCSPIIVQLESAAGIKEGGRSGLSAIVVGIWFALSLFFAPLFGQIPQEATAPVVILIGASMMGQAKEIEWEEMGSAVPAFLTLVIMPFTFSIPNGIFFGLAFNAVLSITCSDRIRLPGSTPVQPFRDPHQGQPLQNQSGQAISYGAVSSVESGGRMNRYNSKNAVEFLRSPTLILRSGEYPKM